MKITNIRITKIEGDIDLLDTDYMPLILDIATKALEPALEELLKDAA